MQTRLIQQDVNGQESEGRSHLQELVECVNIDCSLVYMRGIILR